MVAVVAWLAGCGSLSHDIAPDGRSAGQLVWPDPGHTTPMHKDGTFPNVEALQSVKPGLGKQQISDLIGYPHFNEGAWGVHEWNYLFHFGQQDQAVTCQYKIIFDEHYLARSFYWFPSNCSDLVRSAVNVAPTPEDGQQLSRFDVSADTLFAFGRYREEDMLPEGRGRLSAIAARLSGSRASVVRVIGHTDSIGTVQSNQLLSQRRADAVRSFLVSAGVRADSVLSTGVGASSPLKACDMTLPRGRLIACLQPNRRVEIIAVGMERGSSL